MLHSELHTISTQTDAESIATDPTWALVLYLHCLGSLEPKVHTMNHVLLKHLSYFLKENDASTFLGGVALHEFFEVLHISICFASHMHIFLVYIYIPCIYVYMPSYLETFLKINEKIIICL